LKSAKWVFIPAALVLFAAALRLSHLVDFVEWPDEIWHMWYAQDQLNDVFTRATNDWPPLYGVITWTWRQVAGPHLEVFRLLSVLFSCLALTFVYRSALVFYALSQDTQSLRSDRIRWAALLAGVIFAVLGFTWFEGVNARPYGLLLLSGALSLWMTLRWLRQPIRRRALLVVLPIALMLHTGFTAFTFIAFLTLMVLVFRPRLFLQWVVIGAGVLVLVLPIAPQFLANNTEIPNIMPQPLPPFGEAMLNIYRDFARSIWLWVGLLLALASLSVVFVRFPADRRKVALLLAWILAPALVYVRTDSN
jgi:uncharacterized membrane protein